MNKYRIAIVTVVILVTLLSLYLLMNKNKANKVTNIKDNFKNITNIQELVYHLKNHKNKKALMVRNKRKWNSITFSAYSDLIFSFARALKTMQIENECVAILGFNSPGWFIAHLGSIFSGNISVGIYPTNSSSGTAYILQESNARVLVVENNMQFEKICNLSNFNKLFPTLEYVISYAEPLNDILLADLNIKHISFNQIIKIGSLSNEKMTPVNENSPATLIFTSGSTGNPKGVILTHKNIISNVKAIANELSYLDDEVATQRLMSYLPLNHIASQMTDIYVSGLLGYEVYFPDNKVFKETMIDNLTSIKPTIFIGVPRVWEKIKEGIEKEINKSILKQSGFYLTPFLMSNTILTNIGLNKCKYAVTTSAPLGDETKYFYDKLGLKLYEIYGMSESAGPIAISHPYNYKKGTVGVPLSGVKVEIKNKQLFIGGNAVSPGYLGNARSSYWFNTGDLGEIDEDGYLRIVGREKDIIITSGGENITPCLIENNIKSNIKIIKDAILVGDKKKYLIALVTMECNKNGKLSHDIIHKLKENNIYVKTLSDATKNSALHEYFNKKLLDINKNALSTTQTVKKIVLLPKPLKIETGELTPTLKVKRNVILKKYEKLINKTYS